MPRTLVVILLTVGGLALLAGAVSYLAYGIERLPSQDEIEGLTAEATVILHETGLPVQIQASGEADALRALGYAQAHEMTWQILLWRQAAQGRLAEWLGAKALPLDRHAARLGLALHADSALRALSQHDRQALEAFAQGVSAGMRAASHKNRFVARLGIAAEPFEAADIISIERLFAWCTTDLQRPDSVVWPVAAREFVRDDSLFRHAVGLFGWENSAGWTFRDSSAAITTLRWVTGNAALPVLHESVRYAGADSTLLLTIPGTPFPLLNASRRVVAMLPRGTASVQPTTSRNWDAQFVALSVLEGATYVQPIWRRGDALLLAADTSAAEAWEVRWTGFSVGSDAPRWLDLWRDGAPPPAFELHQGLPFTASAPPPAHPSVTTYQRGWVSALPATLPWLRQRLDTLVSMQSMEASQWFRDAQSVWASTTARALTARLDTSALREPHQRIAYDYLSNWDGGFEGASIAATIFEASARDHGLNPLAGSSAVIDTSRYFVAVRHTRLFAAAADSLLARYGPRPIDWRWEKTHPERRAFPLWSVRDALDLDLPTAANLAPFMLPGEGRATTLRWLDPTPRQANATFVAVVTEGAPGGWQLMRLRFDPRQPFGRYRVADRSLQAITVTYASTEGHYITLRPPAP